MLLSTRDSWGDVSAPLDADLARLDNPSLASDVHIERLRHFRGNPRATPGSPWDLNNDIAIALRPHGSRVALAQAFTIGSHCRPKQRVPVVANGVAMLPDPFAKVGRAGHSPKSQATRPHVKPLSHAWNVREKGINIAQGGSRRWGWPWLGYFDSNKHVRSEEREACRQWIGDVPAPRRGVHSEHHGQREESQNDDDLYPPRFDHR